MMISELFRLPHSRMGCCPSATGLQYEVSRKGDKTYSRSDQNPAESPFYLSVITSTELSDYRSKIHMCPFPEQRMRALKSLNNKLLSAQDLKQILEVYPADNERYSVLNALKGNVRDENENIFCVLDAFHDYSARTQAQELLQALIVRV